MNKVEGSSSTHRDAQVACLEPQDDQAFETQAGTSNNQRLEGARSQTSLMWRNPAMAVGIGPEIVAVGHYAIFINAMSSPREYKISFSGDDIHKRARLIELAIVNTIEAYRPYLPKSALDRTITVQFLTESEWNADGNVQAVGVAASRSDGNATVIKIANSFLQNAKLASIETVAIHTMTSALSAKEYRNTFSRSMLLSRAVVHVLALQVPRNPLNDTVALSSHSKRIITSIESGVISMKILHDAFFKFDNYAVGRLKTIFSDEPVVQFIKVFVPPNLNAPELSHHLQAIGKDVLPVVGSKALDSCNQAIQDHAAERGSSTSVKKAAVTVAPTQPGPSDARSHAMLRNAGLLRRDFGRRT